MNESNTKLYANFLIEMGHNVIITEDKNYWFDAHPKIYQSFPFHYCYDPQKINLKPIFKNGGWVARFPCTTGKGRLSYRISIIDAKYGLSSLNGKSRNQTRRGLENCVVRELTNQEIQKDAITLNYDTLERQGRVLSPHEEEYWNKYYKEIVKLQSASIWGAFINKELAAFLISVNMEGCENILILRSKRSLLKFYPNNALLFTFSQNKIKQDSINEVSIGLESIQKDMDTLDKFKLGMGFKKTPISQFIVLRFPLSVIVNKTTISVLIKIVRLIFREKSEKIAKLEGMLEWYALQK